MIGMQTQRGPRGRPPGARLPGDDAVGHGDQALGGHADALVGESHSFGDGDPPVHRRDGAEERGPFPRIEEPRLVLGLHDGPHAGPSRGSGAVVVLPAAAHVDVDDVGGVGGEELHDGLPECGIARMGQGIGGHAQSGGAVEDRGRRRKDTGMPSPRGELPTPDTTATPPRLEVTAMDPVVWSAPRAVLSPGLTVCQPDKAARPAR
jgi:hypothetical protein